MKLLRRYRGDILAIITVFSLLLILVLQSIAINKMDKTLQEFKQQSTERNEAIAIRAKQNQEQIDALRAYLECILVVPVDERTNAIEKDCQEEAVSSQSVQPTSAQPTTTASTTNNTTNNTTVNEAPDNDNDDAPNLGQRIRDAIMELNLPNVIGE